MNTIFKWKSASSISVKSDTTSSSSIFLASTESDFENNSEKKSMIGLNNISSEKSRSSMDFSEESDSSDENEIFASCSTLNLLDLSDVELPCSKAPIEKEEPENDCLASFNFALPSYQKNVANLIWPSVSSTNKENVLNSVKDTSINVNKSNEDMSQKIPFVPMDELDPCTLDCPGLTSDEDEDDDVGSHISGFTETSVDEDDFLELISSRAKSATKCSSAPSVPNHENKTNNISLTNNMNNTTGDFNISTSLDDIGIKIGHRRELTYEDLKKIDVANKSFTSPIVFCDIPFSTLLKYYKYDDHTRDLFYDRLALMLYTLSYVVKGTGEAVCARYETFFCSYYQISSKTFREWTGFTFFDFMKSKYCTPYFKIIYDEAREKYTVAFNESDKNLSKLGNEMVAVRKVNTEVFRRKLVGIEKKLNDIEDREEFLEEKLKWFQLLAFAPKEQNEIPVQHFQFNFEHHYKEKLDSKYLGSKFIRSTFSGVIKHVFANELEFVAENGGSIKILCDVENAIRKTKEKLEYLRSEDYRKAVQLKKVRLAGDLPPFQRRQSKAPRVWDFNQDIVKGILGDEIQVPLHEKYSSPPLVNIVDGRAKPIYTGSNVRQSDDEDDSSEEL